MTLGRTVSHCCLNVTQGGLRWKSFLRFWCAEGCLMFECPIVGAVPRVDRFKVVTLGRIWDKRP